MPRIMVIIDGLEDAPYDILEGKTPFEFGRGENFLKIEKCGIGGSFENTPKGFEPDTMVCVLTLLGVPPEQIPQGRAYLEGIARNIEILETDLIARTNFVKFDDQHRLIDPACKFPEKLREEIFEYVREQGYYIHQIGEYKSLTIIPNCENSVGIETFPPHQNLGAKFPSLLPKGGFVAKKLGELSKKVYERFAPYGIINWGVGTSPNLPSFKSIHGLTSAMIHHTDIIGGIAKVLGITELSPRETTGETDTNLKEKAKAALDLGETHDIVVVHIGGTDEATHRRNPKEKADFIKRIDSEFLGVIMKNKKVKLLVVSDHGAICTTGEHTSCPTEFWGYSRQNSSKKQLGTVSGNKAINILMKL